MSPHFAVFAPLIEKYIFYDKIMEIESVYAKAAKQSTTGYICNYDI